MPISPFCLLFAGSLGLAFIANDFLQVIGFFDLLKIFNLRPFHKVKYSFLLYKSEMDIYVQKGSKKQFFNILFEPSLLL